VDIAVLVTDNVSDFGLSAILTAFSTGNALRLELPTPPEPWRIRTVSLDTSVRSNHGLIVPTMPLSELPADIDLLIVPAALEIGGEALIDLVSSAANRPVLERILSAYHGGAHMASACTGTFFLAEAGVLDGARATTSWWLGPIFRRRYPRIELDESRLLCRSGTVTTAAAALAHLDLALSLIAAQSPALAELVSRYFLLGDRRTQAEFAIPAVIARGDSLVADFERWVRDHIADQFSMARAARALAVTQRGLQRATQTEIGMTPHEFVTDIRLEHATHLLRTTKLSIENIAARVGYSQASTLHSVFRRRRGRTVAEVRASALVWMDGVGQDHSSTKKSDQTTRRG
jgi:transcriptional regulator GlxA family with amidase domain